MHVFTKRRVKNIRKTVDYLVIAILVVALPAVVVIYATWQFLSSGTSLSPAGPLSVSEKTRSLSWLSTSGNQIVNDNDEPVILRGVNTADVGWYGYEDWVPKAIYQAVTVWKVNVIRTRIYEERYLADPDGYLDQLEKEVVKPARELGAYVILHPFLQDRVPLPTRQTPAMWQAVATRYKNDPTVLYDPLDEPHDVTEDRVRQAYRQLIETIRSVNPRSLIFVTGESWGREINTYALNPLAYLNIVYRSNPYNEAGDFPKLFGDIVGKYPVFFGEFGADGYPPMSREAVKALLTYADAHKIGWTAWTFHSIGCPCLLTDFQTFTVSPYGEIVKADLLTTPR
jgi:endoglucanase